MTLISRKPKKRNLITYFDSDSMISEQFRTIRANIKFMSNEGNNQVILFTSPGNGEGKSTTVANLAVSMAQQNEKILLIDGNLHNPVIHSMFNLRNNQGLSDVLIGHLRPNESIYSTKVGKLDILTSGLTKSNPAELLGKESMPKLLESLSTIYHTILIDAPSVLKSTETRVLANQCDGVVLVVRRGKTKIGKINEAKKILSLAHAKIVGAIVNKI